MKRTLATLALLAATAVAAADYYVFSKDGQKIDSGARPLPTQGVSRTTGDVVVGLGMRTSDEIADCGWYRYVADTNAAPAGCILAGSTLAIVGTDCVQTKTWKPYMETVATWEISKYKLSAALKDAGKLDAFRAILAADEERAFLWQCCQTLDRTNSLVLAIEQLAPETFGMDAATVSNLLW